MHSEEFKTRVFPLQGSLYRFAKSFLNNSQEAEDCVQEIFMKLWMKKETLSSVKNMKGFAMQMIRNLCLDKLKSKKHILLDLGNEIVETKANPHERLEANDTVVWIQNIMNQLPEKQRSTVHLRNIEGLEMSEIAEVTGMSIEHTRVTLSRARIAIRQLYQKHHGNE